MNRPFVRSMGAACLFAALPLTGCFLTHSRGEGSVASVAPDAAPPVSDAGSPFCGSMRMCGLECERGYVLDPATGCPLCACNDPPASCAGVDARGEGPCDAQLGFVWSGTACISIDGCACVGRECDAVQSTLEECLSVHASCVRRCGGFAEVPCLVTEFCDYPDGSFCGGYDTLGVCTPRPESCPEPGGLPVCGCDGVAYLGECSAYFSGTDVRREGPCGRRG